MYLISSISKKLQLLSFALLMAFSGMAQDAATTPLKTETSANNQLAILLVIVTIILAFVIWGMGQVLVELSRQLVQRSKKHQPILSMVILLGFALLSQVTFAQDAAITEKVKVVPNYGGLSATTFYMFITVIGMELIAILFLAFSIKRVYAELMPEKAKTSAKKSSLSLLWSKLDKKLFTKAIPVEQEADVLLDHDYDGIHELDNALPPWWKYGFYITVGVAFLYLLNFHVLGLGKNPEEEYGIEMEKASIEKEIFEAQNKDKVDENNISMADATGIQAGQKMFEADCVACHLKGAGSQEPLSVGPNLTDEYWLHKGSLNDIYKTIKNGYPDKGMQSWSNKYNPKEISQLASYIKTLRGVKQPNAKLPQGEMYVESSTVPAGDSAKTVKADSVSAVKK